MSSRPDSGAAPTRGAFTAEQSFRKLSSNQMQFSRTRFFKGTTDVRWVRLKRSTRAECAHLRRTTMLRKFTLALVAAATLSAMALAPSAASAKPWGGGWGGGWGGYYHHHH